MNLIQKGHEHTHRGIIGIESAIVLIAFVIVAAALAFVVLNMGLVAGKITAGGWVTQDSLNVTNIPLKIVSGGATSNLDGNFTSVKYISDNVEYDNVYTFGPLFLGSYVNASTAWDRAVVKGWIAAAEHPYKLNGAPPNTIAIIYWTVNQNNNTILDIGEHVVLSVAFSTNDKPAALENISFEVSTPKGSPMTVGRNVPNITTQIVDLG